MKKYERPNKGQYIYSIGQLTTYTPSSPEDMQKVEKIFKKHPHYIDFNRERGYYQFGWDEDPEESQPHRLSFAERHKRKRGV